MGGCRQLLPTPIRRVGHRYRGMGSGTGHLPQPEPVTLEIGVNRFPFT